MSQTLSTVSSTAKVTKPNPRWRLVCWSISITASSTAPAGVRVIIIIAPGHENFLTKLCEVFLHLLSRSFLADTSNKYLLGFIFFTLWFGSCWLGVNFLTINKMRRNSKDSFYCAWRVEGDEPETTTSLELHTLELLRYATPWLYNPLFHNVLNIN